MSTKTRAALKLAGLTPEAKVTKAQGIIDAMQSSDNFVASEMPLSFSDMQNLIDNLHTAIIAANAGTVTSTSYMHEKERVLVSAFNLIKSHVEYVANNSVDATTIINSANMQVFTNGGSNTVSELSLSTVGNGSIAVRVPRNENEKAFVFEKSTDGTTFTKATSSSLTKITLSGFTAGATVYVRYYAISKTGESATSAAKYIMVV